MADAERPEPWWYEAPIAYEIFAGIDRLHPKVSAAMARIEKLGPAKIAQAIDQKLIAEWPFELTRKGKSVLARNI